jgi:hypothetical protein
MTSIEFRFDQRRHVDAVDDEILDLAMYVDVDQVDAAHHDATQIHALKLGVVEVHATKFSAAQIDVLESGTT